MVRRRIGRSVTREGLGGSITADDGKDLADGESC